MAGSWGSGFAHALTQGLVGAQEGEDERLRKVILLAAQQRAERREAARDADQRALTASTLRDRGYVPVAEMGPNSQTLLSGASIDQLANMATGGVAGPQIGLPDAKAPRYSSAVGGYVYDSQSPAAQDHAAKLAQAQAETAWMTARPTIAQRQLDVREANAEANRTSRETIAAGHDAASLQRASMRRTAMSTTHKNLTTAGTVTPAVRLSNIRQLAQTYSRPAGLGGMGLNPVEAMAQATRDVDALIASGPTKGPLPEAGPVARQQSTTVQDPSSRESTMDVETGRVTPGPPPNASEDPIDAGVRILRGMPEADRLRVLESSKKSEAYKNAVAQRLGIPRQPKAAAAPVR